MSDPLVPLDDGLLQESTEELYDQAPCGYFSTLPDGTFVRANQTFLTWTGYCRDELIGRKRFQDLLTIGGKVFHETHYAPLLRMQGGVNEVALDLVCKDGQTLPVLVNTIQKRDSIGEPRLNRTTVFNATDRRHYERELLLARRKAEDAAETKARLLAMISHEIRSPLNTIVLLSDLLRHTGASQQQEKHLQTLKSASQHLAELVNHLLDYSKLESGRMPVDHRPFGLREMVAGVVQRLHPRAEAKGISLSATIDDQIPDELIGDSMKLGQVLTNLVGNAVKFTEHGSVCIAVSLADGAQDPVVLEFSVRDTGIGIPPDRVAEIFEEFTQASPDVMAKYGGTGLGLTISRKLLRLLGSDIKVKSTPGEGSTFSFSLRLERATAEPVAQQV